MFNKEFLKKLTILYVEDEALAREQLAKTLQRLFGTVLLAADGQEGYKVYQKHIASGEHIDLVVSDINMPNLNGIEMLEKIRETNKDIPFIFTTARSETEYLLKAIELRVNHYALKPIDTDDIIMRIQTVCEKRYFERKLELTQGELKNYLRAIDNVAVVFKMREDGNIIFANECFLETTKYLKEEIKALHFSHIIHPDLPKKFIDDTWEMLKRGEIWKGNTKYITKFQELFYLNATIFKIDNDDQDEYITIGFLTTQEQIEKREFHKKVMINIKENKQKNFDNEQTIQQQTSTLMKFKEHVLHLEDQLKQEKQKVNMYKKQLDYYEKKSHMTDVEKNDFLQTAKSRISEATKSYQVMKKEKELCLVKQKGLEEELTMVKEEMEKLYTQAIDKDKKILRLEDLIQYRESQIMLHKPDLLRK